MGSTLKLTLAILLAVLTSSALATDWVGVVKRSTGQVSLVRGGEQLPAPAGTEVRRGDRLITGRNGYVNVRIRGAAPVSVGPQASVVLDRYLPKDQQVPHPSMAEVLQGLASAFTVNRYR